MRKEGRAGKVEGVGLNFGECLNGRQILISGHKVFRLVSTYKVRVDKAVLTIATSFGVRECALILFLLSRFWRIALLRIKSHSAIAPIRTSRLRAHALNWPVCNCHSSLPYCRILVVPPQRLKTKKRSAHTPTKTAQFLLSLFNS